ncbi:2-hydroxyacid dehydrogenase [Brevibacillus sp. SYSU BS000544]|uniref:2-hydroxyacid dehydrogenase n=1 Tax=Brevibacillus sp. SYSU BS000544 TaxID=3416443 RepID=UPI003CE460D5
MKPRIFVTRRIPEQALCLLREQCEVSLWDEEDVPVPRDVLEREIENADGLYTLLTEKIDAPLLERAKKLKAISNMAVGYNNIDVQSATERGIIVTNTPDVLTETTADLTFALLMATARRLMEASYVLRAGEWKTWSPMMLAGQDVYGATMGIIGLGRIGEAIAKRAKGFDMKVLYHNRSQKPEAEERLGIIYSDMDELLRTSDYVVIMAPYTPETHHLIGERELDLMKKTGILINTARGGIVDEQALYDALVTKRIWAAGLDVFEVEPVSLDHPLLTLPNVVTLPHIGSASIATRVGMATLAADNLLRAVLGQTPKHVVNPKVLS